MLSSKIIAAVALCLFMVLSCHAVGNNFTASHRMSSRRPTLEAYNELRDAFFQQENSRALGADITLTRKELLANQIIMDAKNKEYERGFAIPHLFTPSRHIFEVLQEIKKSPLFKLISKMPKGGVLHSHDTAMCTTDFIIELTYRENLWACRGKGQKIVKAFKFSNVSPASESETDCTWVLLSQLREELGANKVDNDIRKGLTFYPTMKYLDNDDAWKHFTSIFALLSGLLFYAPVWADYYYNALKEFRADGVQYLEVRSTLPILYDLEGTNYTQLDTVRIYKETSDRFMAQYPDFIGSKMIFSPQRDVGFEGFKNYLKVLLESIRQYPDFVAGFDLVGQEERGHPLTDYIPQLLSLPDGIDFFFHAGETNWYGSTVDENLIDTVLLGAKRIGHGFALVKHPQVMELVKQRDIAVEMNPISNQVLQLVSDYRNHPCAQLFADNYPVVISSDDPSFWKATPLSHDFYIAFLGIASAHSDLRLLKKLALNSINYSSLSSEQKTAALAKWQTKWNKYIDQLIRDNNNNNSNNAAQSRLTTNRIN